MFKLAIVAAAVVLACTLGGRLMEHKVSGATADETFADPAVAKLARAACAGDAGDVARLAASGVPVNSVATKDNKNDADVLIWVLSCGNVAGFEALLKAGANPNLGPGKFGITPTYIAATHPDPAFLRLALKHGGDPNARTNDGDSALFAAFELGNSSEHWDNYYSLLDSGVDLNQAHRARGTGIASFAASDGRIDKAIELLKRGYSYNLESLAIAIYDNSLASTMSDGSKPGRNDPQYKYLGMVARMLKDRGVDTEQIKRRVDDKNKAVGAGIVQDYSFENAAVVVNGTALR